MAITIGLLLLLFFEKASLEVLGIGLIFTLVAAGILSYEEAAVGFGNKAVITIAGLYVIGEGLTRTGAVTFVGSFLLRYSGGGQFRLILLMGLAAALVSAFLNDTAVVVVFIPILLDLARKTGIPASRLMMPLAFSALLGGVCTLVGTSTNLIVSGIAEKTEGFVALEMFTMSPVGIPVAIVGVVFLAVCSKWFLPVRQSLTVMMGTEAAREYVTEMRIGPESPLIGKSYAEAFEAMGTQGLFFVRNESMQWPPFDNATVEAGDIIMVKAGLEELAEMEQKLDLKFLHDTRIDPRKMQFFEVALSPRSRLIGTKVGDLHMNRDFGVTVVAMLRAGQHIDNRAAELTIKSGDLLLVCGDEESQERIRSSQEFYLLESDAGGFVLRRRAKRAMAIASMVVVSLACHSIFKWEFTHPALASMVGAAAMVGFGCLTPRMAYKAIDWPILIFIVGTLALGDAMEKSGLAAFFGDGLTSLLLDWGAAAVVSALMLLCIVFNFFVGHSAVAVLFAPIAVTTSSAVGKAQGFQTGDPGQDSLNLAFILAVCFGASACFATPIGHQVNLMVYGPGSYRYLDYVRLGLPLSVVIWITASVGIALFTGI